MIIFSSKVDCPVSIAGSATFSFVHSVQTYSEAHLASYPVDTPGVKRSGSEANHYPPSTDEVEKGGDIPPLPHMSSWHNI
jgi:hypothetical protein